MFSGDAKGVSAKRTGAQICGIIAYSREICLQRHETVAGNARYFYTHSNFFKLLKILCILTMDCFCLFCNVSGAVDLRLKMQNKELSLEQPMRSALSKVLSNVARWTDRRRIEEFEQELENVQPTEAEPGDQESVIKNDPELSDNGKNSLIMDEGDMLVESYYDIDELLENNDIYMERDLYN